MNPSTNISPSNISFVIPAYNAASTLAEAVDSIFNNNFEAGDEVIIVNDFSTDATGKIAEELATKYSPNVTVISNPENKGCPASRNVGIARTKNALIFNLDSDNILAPGDIAPLKAALLAENADVAAMSEYYYFKTSTKEINHRWLCKTGTFTLADLLSGMVNQAPGGNYLYRKSTWERIGKYWEYGKGLHEAWGFSIKLLLAGAKFIVAPNTFYYHRYSHQSLFVRESTKKDESMSVSNKFIVGALPLLDDVSRKYVESNPLWFDTLEQHPLRLKDGSVGINGKIVFTSPLKNVIYKLKKLMNK